MWLKLEIQIFPVWSGLTRLLIFRWGALLFAVGPRLSTRLQVLGCPQAALPQSPHPRPNRHHHLQSPDWRERHPQRPQLPTLQSILQQTQPFLRGEYVIVFNFLTDPKYTLFLFSQVRLKPDSSEEMMDQLTELLQGEFDGQSGIIYTLSIKDTEQLSEQLRNRGISALPYHASLEADSR